MVGRIVTNLLDPPARRHLPPQRPPEPQPWRPLLVTFALAVLLILGAMEGFLRVAVTVCPNAGMDTAKCGEAPGWTPLILHDWLEERKASASRTESRPETTSSMIRPEFTAAAPEKAQVTATSAPIRYAPAPSTTLTPAGENGFPAYDRHRQVELIDEGPL